MWQDFGSCTKFDPKLWDIDDTTSTERAQAVGICASCPVMANCLDAAQRKPPYRMIMAGYAWIAPSTIPLDAVRERRGPKVKVHTETPRRTRKPVQLESAVA